MKSIVCFFKLRLILINEKDLDRWILSFKGFGILIIPIDEFFYLSIFLYPIYFQELSQDSQYCNFQLEFLQHFHAVY